jgi:hypothetical protein
MALTVTQSYPVSEVLVWTYDNLDTADTAPSSITVGGAMKHGSIQASGTFGGGTVALQGSNDGTNWFSLADLGGTAIALTAAGGSEFRTTTLYVRPIITGGTADDVDVLVLLR